MQTYGGHEAELRYQRGFEHTNTRLRCGAALDLTAAAIERLNRLGISLKIITGDNPRVAATVARQVGAVAAGGGRFVARLPLDSDGVVRLLAVIHPPHYPATAPEALETTLWNAIAAATEEMRLQMETAVRRAKDVFPQPLETEVVVGPVAHEIVRACQCDTDLVVLGARGLSTFKRWLLGSVSDNVLRHAPCSVLVVKHEPQTGTA